VRSNFSSIAVAARDAIGFLLLAWTKHIDVVDPEVAKASAILWVIQLAKLEGFPNVIIESDSKVPIDAINSNPKEANWKISAIVSDVNFLHLNLFPVVFPVLKETQTRLPMSWPNLLFPLIRILVVMLHPSLPLLERLGKGMGWVFLSLCSMKSL
jgi:hypothetical protein